MTAQILNLLVEFGDLNADLNQGFVYGISTKEIDLDFENLATSFHYDSIFGTVINRFISQVACNLDMSVYGERYTKKSVSQFNRYD